jgi:macrolide transport system ATP-binding/permease protein
VRDAENRIERLREQRVPKPPKPLAFSAALTSDVPTGVLISAREIDVPGRITIDALDVSADTRLLITGPNGAGKSSLLAVLAGALEPERGRVMLARGLRIGWLPQEGAFPDPTATALQVFAAGRAGAPEDHQADLVGLGLLPPRDVHTPVGRLSLGQQRRLALARLLTSSPHVLLLDEPTNHLSLTLVEELEAAVLGSKLPVVAVSHDRWLRRRWTGDELRHTTG